MSNSWEAGDDGDALLAAPVITGRPERPLEISSAWRLALSMVALLAVAFNMRPTITGTPPLLSEIQRSLQIDSAVGGLLTSLPVLCMALFAPAAHRMAHRFGREGTVLAAVGLIAAGDALRFGGNLGTLFAGTALAGTGIAVCGVTLPGVISDLFPDRSDRATSAYLVALMLGATVGPIMSAPLRSLLGSWPAALAVWSLPSLGAVLLWVPVVRTANVRAPGNPSTARRRLPWRSRGAWLLALFMSAQQVLAYAYTAWLPPSYEARGWSIQQTGALLGLLHIAQLASTMIVPLIAIRRPDRRPLLVGTLALSVIGAVWLAVLPATMTWAATSVLGLGIGAGFSLGLIVLADYAADAPAATGLTAMVFLVSYGAAALSPVTVGTLRDATGSFTLPFSLLIVVAVIELGLGSRLDPRHRGEIH